MRLDVVDEPSRTEFVFLAETDSEQAGLMRFSAVVRPFRAVRVAQDDQRIVVVQRHSTLKRTADLLRQVGRVELRRVDIAERLGVPKTNVSTALGSLKDSGLVERRHGLWRWKGRR